MEEDVVAASRHDSPVHIYADLTGRGETLDTLVGVLGVWPQEFFVFGVPRV